MPQPTTITIITSPTVVATPLPGHAPASPTASSSSGRQAPVQYRIEERHRTVYITSDQPPESWDQQSITQLLQQADYQGAGDTLSPNINPPVVRRNKSSNGAGEPQIIVIDDPTAAATSPRRRNPSLPDPSRISTYYYPHSPKMPKSPQPGPVDLVRKSPRASPMRQKILFYHKNDPYYGFTNFSAHPVIHKGKSYPTSEHLFQSFKFQKHRPNLAEHIRTCSDRPSVAFAEARRFSPETRHDWKDVNIEKMDETIWLKFTQHRDLQAELLSTGDAELIEDSDKDAFWGVGPDGKGRNELGKALGRLRTRLREMQAQKVHQYHHHHHQERSLQLPGSSE